MTLLVSRIPKHITAPTDLIAWHNAAARDKMTLPQAVQLLAERDRNRYASLTHNLGIQEVFIANLTADQRELIFRVPPAVPGMVEFVMTFFEDDALRVWAWPSRENLSPSDSQTLNDNPLYVLEGVIQYMIKIILTVHGLRCKTSTNWHDHADSYFWQFHGHQTNPRRQRDFARNIAFEITQRLTSAE